VIRLGGRLRLKGDELTFRAKASPPDALLAKLKEHKAEIVTLLRAAPESVPGEIDERAGLASDSVPEPHPAPSTRGTVKSLRSTRSGKFRISITRRIRTCTKRDFGQNPLAQFSKRNSRCHERAIHTSRDGFRLVESTLNLNIKMRILATKTDLDPNPTRIRSKTFNYSNAASNPTWRKWLPSDPTSPHWYDAERLGRLRRPHSARRRS
jgi:hypothetical protein